MTPEELAEIHPRLYHVAAPTALAGIKRHGLLSARELASKFQLSGERRRAVLERIRPRAITVSHPEHGEAEINDNSPLSEAALLKCLDDELTPSDWLSQLNRRVFFWADQSGLESLLRARFNRDRERLVLVFDTLSLARRYANKIEISPINSGSTIRRPARRGRGTFSSLEAFSYQEWRRLRGRLDKIKEVTVLDRVEHAESMIVDSYRTVGVTPILGNSESALDSNLVAKRL
ncbi:MAG: hypothetical protein AAF236_04460 [Verrucomicrobiota bacterium]